MQKFFTAALGAALLFGCSDDSDGDDLPRDSSVPDAAARDGGPDLDANIDANIGQPLDAATDGDRPPTLDAGVQRAMVTLVSRSGSSTTGEGVFSVVNGVVTLNLTVRGATPGLHGAHIHVLGDCSAPNASSAGDHWDPAMTNPHGSGAPDAGASHLGDLGNILIAADGVGMLTIGKTEWTLGDGSQTDILNKGLIIHANADDLVTQAVPDAGITPGNAGGRIACGEIQAEDD